MPVVDFSSIPQKVVNVLAGKTLELDLPIVGRPPPACAWFFDDNRIKITDRVKIKSTGKFSKLTMSDTTIDDSGDYTLEVKNAVGVITEVIKVVILCKNPCRIVFQIFSFHLLLILNIMTVIECKSYPVLSVLLYQPNLTNQRDPSFLKKSMPPP